jgi:hypothetical protein
MPPVIVPIVTIAVAASIARLFILYAPSKIPFKEIFNHLLLPDSSVFVPVLFCTCTFYQGIYHNTITQVFPPFFHPARLSGRHPGGTQRHNV